MKNEKQNLVTNLPVPIEFIERRIYLIRGVKVMLDSDLADLYQVETKMLNRAVKRNIDRFPSDFMFQLSKTETENLRFQIGTSSSSYGGRRYAPNAFTEQGVAMLSSVLNSRRAILVNIAIVRAFVKLREAMATHKGLAKKIEELEDKQKKQGLEIAVIFDVIKKLISPANPPKKIIGFRT